MNDPWKLAMREMQISLEQQDLDSGLRTGRGRPVRTAVLSTLKLLEDPRLADELAAVVNYTGTAVKADGRRSRPSIMLRVPEAMRREFVEKFTSGAMFPTAGREGSASHLVSSTLDQYILGRLLRSRSRRWRSLAEYLVLRGHVAMAGPDNLEMLLRIGRFAPPGMEEASREVFGEAGS